MKYNSIIIGGGLAGLTSAIRCAEAGLKTALISAGDSALTFASGSIDVLGIRQNNSLVQYPFEEISHLPSGHPYQKLGAGQVKQSLHFFTGQMAKAGIQMSSHGQQNHSRLTALGAIRPTWLSQPGTKALSIAAPAAGLRRVAIINIAGFRDFQPALVAAGMKKHPEFAGVEFTVADINAETVNINARNAYELRSLEMARLLKRDLFSQPKGLTIFASAIQKAAGNADLVVLPSVLAVENGNELISQLEAHTGLHICELATLPPSLPGMRMANALRQRYRELGGLLLEGDEVLSGYFDNNKLNSIKTRLNPSMPLEADHFILATGSFFSRGLDSNQSSLTDKTFNLDVVEAGQREQWSNERFLNGHQHGFSYFGIETNERFNPYQNGKAITNLYCAGGVLGGFNPVAEASAGGVAISTGWFAANQIIAQRSGSSGTAK
ncbi:glycerol-3-phosphate dehydrogenase subunit GlpB [Endozoicomonas lisbonensis]|uniref:Glycerol-3-phosphate dehydrogenase subunit B n=1 Tax=Endozoicomonas lisbonensis TaxID=3120522 RepID=A0ABV2SFZ2_9GAMM